MAKKTLNWPWIPILKFADMGQVLIVEGNDAIPLAVICQQKGLNRPKGYTTDRDFKAHFTQKAGGFEQVFRVLSDKLRNTDISRIGVVVDADNRMAAQVIQEKFRPVLLTAGFAPNVLDACLTSAAPGPWVVQEPDMPVVGIWIMPDNHGNGYLEHFIANLVPEEDPLIRAVDESIEHLTRKEIRKFSEAKVGKARLHTWLAWQEDPGKPFGTALQAGYFNLNHPLADAFTQWFERVFELG
jgi:hypothetical protein